MQRVRLNHLTGAYAPCHARCMMKNESTQASRVASAKAKLTVAEASTLHIPTEMLTAERKALRDSAARKLTVAEWSALEADGRISQ